MNFKEAERIREEETIRFAERQRLQSKIERQHQANADASDMIQEHGKLGSFFITIIQWLAIWTILAFVIFIAQVFKGWTGFWDGFSDMIGAIGSGYVVFGLIGLWKASRFT